MAEGAAPAIAHRTRTLNTGAVIRELMTGKSDNYEGPENFVTSVMKIDEERIQSYISTGETQMGLSKIAGGGKSSQTSRVTSLKKLPKRLIY